MTDLHASLLAAITARQERAQAATPGPWTMRKGDRMVPGCRCLSCWEDWPDAWIILEVDGPPGADTSPTVYRHDAEFIAAESPDVVLRQCTEDLLLLDLAEDYRRLGQPDSAAANAWRYVIRSLARRYGIDTNGDQA